MLAVAYAMSGDAEGFVEQLNEIDEVKPRTSLERLFVGQAWMYEDTERGLPYIRQADQELNSPLSKAILADALSHRALETGNYAQYAELAVQYAKSAQVMMPENGYVVMVALWAHVTAIQISDENNVDLDSLRRDASRIAVQLKDFPNNSVGLGVCVHYLDFVENDAKAALEFCREAIGRGSEGHIQNQAAALAYRLEGRHAALKLLSPDRPLQNIWVALAQADVIAFDGDSSELEGVYNFLSKNRDAKWQWSIPEMVLAQHPDPGYCRERCLNRLMSGDDLTEWERIVLEYLADDLSPEAFIDAVLENNQTKPKKCLAVAHKLIAMKCLSVGDRTNAKSNFEKCLETRYFAVEFTWAKAFLERLNGRLIRWRRKDPAITRRVCYVYLKHTN